MSMINLFVMTAAQRTTAMGMDDDANAAINPRAIDNASPGVGINLNDLVTGVSPGDVVTLTGKYVVNKRIVDDPDYNYYCPTLGPWLLANCPYCSLESETIFAPFEP